MKNGYTFFPRIGLLFTAILFFVTSLFAHSVELISSSYVNGNTLLTYKVTSGSSPALSHWSLELCADIYADSLISVSGGETWELVTSANQHEIFDGIKFDDGYNDNEERQFTLTIQGEWQIGTVNVRFKGGLQYEDATVDGPICEEVEESLAPVVPMILCVQDVGDDSLDVEVGYYNPNPCAVELTGSDNVVSPSGYASFFPTVLQPYQAGATCDDDTLTGGTPSVENYTGPTFTVRIANTESLIWELTTDDNPTETAVASDNSERCEEEESLAPVVPMILCVQDVGDDSLDVEVGYYNPNPCAVELTGSDNVVSPSGYASFFPTVLQPYQAGAACDDNPLTGGTPSVENYTGPTFTVRIANTESLIWELTTDDNPKETAVASDDSERCEEESSSLPIIPLLLCISDAGDGVSEVMFGYYNPNPCPIFIAQGSDNQFNLSQFNSELPETFEPYISGQCDQVSLKKTLNGVNGVPNPEDYTGPVFSVFVQTGTTLEWTLQLDNNPEQKQNAITSEPICFSEEETSCVSGQVIDENQPVSGVVVRLERDGYKTSKQVTDENGYYQFETVELGTYSLWVQGYPDSRRDVVVDGSEAPCMYEVVDLGGCRPLFSFYQPWYGSIENPDSLRHWIEEQLGSVSDMPLFELYDSYDPNIWEYHILLAWAADIDAFIVDWYGSASFENVPMIGLLDAAQSLYEKFGKYGFDFRIISKYNESGIGELESNLQYLSENVVEHPAYWGTREGAPRPVYVFSPTQLLDPKTFREASDIYLPEDVVLGWNWMPQLTDLNQYVDTVYPWVQDVRLYAAQGDSLDWGESYLDMFYSQAVGFNYLTGASWPGYDDRPYVLGEDFYFNRQDTAVYKWTWDKAHENVPEWLVVTSFNDLNRGTHIETSALNELSFVKETRNEALEWKGSCARNVDDLGLTVPQEVFRARERGVENDVIESALAEFFSRNYYQALQILKQGMEFGEPDNSLAFVRGSETYSKGYMEWNWENAVDGDYSGWDGVTMARGDAADAMTPAWAIFEFTDKRTYKFKYAVVTTDDGTASPNQADRFEIYVSTTTDDMAAFTKVGDFRRKGSGEEQWYNLGNYVAAKYVMLKLPSPYHLDGGWRKLTEFRLESQTKQGPLPAVDEETAVEQPSEFVLQPNFPNPFNPVTTISYNLPIESRVTVTVYDIQGRQVAELVNTVQPAGSHQVKWDAQDVSSGMYLYRIQADGFQATRRMVLLK